jgi:hypothetical protein
MGNEEGIALPNGDDHFAKAKARAELVEAKGIPYGSWGRALRKKLRCPLCKGFHVAVVYIDPSGHGKEYLWSEMRRYVVLPFFHDVKWLPGMYLSWCDRKSCVWHELPRVRPWPDDDMKEMMRSVDTFTEWSIDPLTYQSAFTSFRGHLEIGDYIIKVLEAYQGIREQLDRERGEQA